MVQKPELLSEFEPENHLKPGRVANQYPSENSNYNRKKLHPTAFNAILIIILLILEEILKSANNPVSLPSLLIINIVLLCISNL